MRTLAVAAAGLVLVTSLAACGEKPQVAGSSVKGQPAYLGTGVGPYTAKWRNSLNWAPVCANAPSARRLCMRATARSASCSSLSAFLFPAEKCVVELVSRSVPVFF